MGQDGQGSSIHRQLEELSPPIAFGRTAEIYSWDEDLVLKLFYPRWGEETVQFEAAKAMLVHTAKLPAPAAVGVIEVDHRWGILYQRISGIPLTRIIQTKPLKLITTARQMADLHLQVHQCQIPELPPIKLRLARIIHGIHEMPEDWRAFFLNSLERLPDRDIVCHGDFHPENIYLTPQGLVILDWMDAVRGSPLADLARTEMLLRKAALPPDLPGRRFIQVIRALFTRSYLARYFSRSTNGTNYDPNEWAAWRGIIAAARLAEDIPHEREILVPYLQAVMNKQSQGSKSG